MLLIVWGVCFCMIRQKDLLFYQNLMKEKAIASSNNNPNYSSTNQLRKGVRKDIWFAQDDDSRLQYRIESTTSTLTLLPVKNKFEIIETLGKVKCWTQDKLYYSGEEPMQQARYLEASEGVYHYGSQQFNAQGVSLSLFRLPGHNLATQSLDLKKSFLSGLAKSVTFTVSGKTPQFQAEQFKATLTKQESK